MRLTFDNVRVPEERKVVLIYTPAFKADSWTFLWLQHLVVYRNPFLYNDGSKNSHMENLTGSLFLSEIEKATLSIAKVSDKNLRVLNPFISEDDLMRVGGKLENSDVLYN